MPCVHRIEGVKICIYADDENPPHFHVRSGDSNAKIRIGTLQIMRGEITRSDYAKVVDWAARNQELLDATWREYNERD